MANRHVKVRRQTRCLSFQCRLVYGRHVDNRRVHDQVRCVSHRRVRLWLYRLGNDARHKLPTRQEQEDWYRRPKKLDLGIHQFRCICVHPIVVFIGIVGLFACGRLSLRERRIEKEKNNTLLRSEIRESRDK